MNLLRSSIVMSIAAGFFFVGLSSIAGQNSEPPPEPATFEAGVWAGSVQLDGVTNPAGEVAFVVGEDGLVSIGAIRFDALGEVSEDVAELLEQYGCFARFAVLSSESLPAAVASVSEESVGGTYLVDGCQLREWGFYRFTPPLEGTWQAAPVVEDAVADVEPIYTREPEVVIEEGEALFLFNCSPCHGRSGNGTTAAPPLTDFYALPHDFVESRVRSGPAEMSYFSEDDLADFEVEDIILFIQQELVGTGIREYTEEELEEGRALYIEKCAECHGNRGQGTNDYAGPLLIWPPYSVTGIYEGARIPLPEMGIVRVSDEELDLIAGYYLELATAENE